ncbi:hypothetical protein HME9304_01745 [Flagellimonas maritima]|uniref:Uncharacterized protein n=1 Tax=Flagellimonas maritima TaxID=1383885 RepID=A0A2Z4LSP1_9FLAO|nr:hypothetical protein HME9304_01745 [Allomuricauda aurantiaca]
MISRNSVSIVRRRMKANTAYIFMYSGNKTTIQSKINSHFRLLSVDHGKNIENKQDVKKM